MKVKCINGNGSSYLSTGEVYEAKYDPAYRSYKIVFEGVEYTYRDDRFEPVEDTQADPEPKQDGWSNAHYNFDYTLSEEDKKRGTVRVDAYFVARQWKLGQKDDSGVLFHCLKTITRFGGKNSREREIIALHAQIKRLAELEGVTLL